LTKKQKRRAASTEFNGIPIDAPDAPTENSDAGPAPSAGDDHAKRRIRDYRTNANRHFAAARRLTRMPPSVDTWHEAESEARLAIDQVVRAFWWAEDTDAEERQHRLMHEVGRWTRQTFGGANSILMGQRTASRVRLKWRIEEWDSRRDSSVPGSAPSAIRICRSVSTSVVDAIGFEAAAMQKDDAASATRRNATIAQIDSTLRPLGR
jgi:hypothetical protein